MRCHRSLGILAVLFALSLPALSNVPRTTAGPSIGRNDSPERVKKSRESSLYLPDRVIVKLKAAAQSSKAAQTFGVPALDAFAGRYPAASAARMFPGHAAPRSEREVDLTQFYTFRFAGPIDAFAVAEELSLRPEVEYAEPSFIYKTSDAAVFTPNDTSFSKQWHLLKVKADSAWSITQGDTTVVIGIIDTGVQWDHPDLAANIWINPGEDGPDGLGGNKRTNSLDDDLNGKVDDYHGWDFGGADYNVAGEDNNPTPIRASHGHGTHVAGIASAVTNNVTGVAGIGFQCRILAVKASSDNDLRGSGGSPYIIAGFEGIQYAADMGADIISLSWGGSGFAQFEQDMVNYATGKGSLIFGAAGNTGSAADPQYPASYENAFSVAATQLSEVKATYSSYGEYVDLSAPGGDGFSATTQILSTFYPSNYAYITGTSMATPLAAGAAALVKSFFPAYSPIQVGEQLRVTCDDIYGPNSTYRYKLGKGRINVYRALTVASPSVRMSQISARDSVGGNNNGTFEPNEDVALWLTLTNYLQPTSPSATATLSTTNPYVTISGPAFPFGTLGTMAAVSNVAAPFGIHVNSNIPSSTKVTFLLTITDGAYLDRYEFSLFFNPTYATHFVNNVDVTLTNNGKIGFNNFPDNTQGIGFIFNGQNQLFEGGLMVGYSTSKIVDVVRNPTAVPDADFGSAQIYDLQTPGTISDQDGSAVFTDGPAISTNKLGIQVNMFSYEFTSAPDDDYVLVRYDIKNTNAAPLTGVFAGLFFDWDVMSPDNRVDSYDFNRTGFDAGRGLGYAWYDTTIQTTYCGVKALEGAAGFRALLNSATIDLSRAAKYAWLSGGIVTDTTVGDVHLTLSSGPYTIPAGGTQMIAFAIAGGDGLADLQASADAAQAKWNYIKTLLDVAEEGAGLPSVYALRQNYPNPFNPTTVVSYDLPEASVVTIKVVNMLGQEVAALVVNEERTAGTHRVTFDGAGLASGVYLCQLRAEPVSGRAAGAGFTDMKKLLLLR